MEERDRRLLEEMRDLLREEVRLRQVGIEEQRAFQARAQEQMAAASRKQRLLNFILLAFLLLFAGSSFAVPLLLSLFGSGLFSGQRGLSGVTVPSAVETAKFDGAYDLIAERSFADSRARLQAETDPARRSALLRLVGLQARRMTPFRIDHGVIRAGTGIVQEFSLQSARVEGDTLQGRVVWHEDANDPGDASEESIRMTLVSDTLEFAMLGEDGKAHDPAFLRRRP